MAPSGSSHHTLADLVSGLVRDIESTDFPPLSPDSRYILAKFYRTIHGPYSTTFKADSSDLEAKVKSPLIVSFHPKLSLLNNNVHETLLAIKLAEQLDQVPLWIPYVYDTATHSAAEGGKIRAPTYAFVENQFVTLRPASQIHGNIIKTERSIQSKEFSAFFRALEDHLTQTLGNLQSQLNPYNFGHALFDLKQKVMGFNAKKLRQIVHEYRQEMQSAAKPGKNLGECLALISLSLLERLGIRINVGFIEHVLPELVWDIFSKIIEMEQVQADPALLEGLFLHYNKQNKARTALQFTGTEFLGYDENAVCHFQGNLEALCKGLETDEILPTGPLLILLFSALGCQVTLGGLHTTEYYPDYLKNAQALLKGTGFNADMRVIGYGGLRCLDTRSMTDIRAVARILEKVGSRRVVQQGEIAFPRDVVDHLHFLAGSGAVPDEYHPLLEEIVADQKPRPPALEKEQARFAQIRAWAKLPGQDLKAKTPELKPYFRKLPLDELHPER